MFSNRKFIFLVTPAIVLAALPVSALAGYNESTSRTRQTRWRRKFTGSTTA